MTSFKFGDFAIMKKITYLIIVLIGFIACKKDNVETKPTLKLESMSSEFVPRNQNLSLTFTFTDKEGDISDSIFMIRTRLNRRGPLTRAAIPYKVPEFPSKSKGEIVLELDYRLDITTGIPALSVQGNNTQREPDTLQLKFVLRDKAKNLSDTAVANVIVERF